MRSKTMVIGFALLLLLAGLVSACGGAAPEPAAPDVEADEPVALDGETLLQERCTECHGLDRTTSAQKTRAEWDTTVTRMVSRGAELNDEEKTVLLDYLAETYGP